MVTMFVVIGACALSCMVLCYVVLAHLKNYHLFLEKLYRPARNDEPLPLQVTPISAIDAEGTEMIFVCAPGYIKAETADRIERTFVTQLKGTSLEGTKVLVFGEGLRAEFVKTKTGPRAKAQGPSLH